MKKKNQFISQTISPIRKASMLHVNQANTNTCSAYGFIFMKSEFCTCDKKNSKLK